MKKTLSILLCITLILCLIPTTSSFAAKKIKSKSVSIAPKSMTLAIGDIAQLNATMKPSNSTDKLSWSSSNKTVATVTSKGMVKGKAVGKATITVKTTSKKTAKCTVVVKQYATKDDILATIKENTYTKDEVDSRISSMETDVKEYVSSDESTTSIIEKLNSVFATEDSVLALIKQNTYTKSEIDTLIKSAEPSSNNTWKDGTELTLFNGIKIHNTIPGEFPIRYEGEELPAKITINEASVKKYHYEDYFNYGLDFRLFKYVLDIRGTLPASNQQGTYDVHVNLFDSAFSACDVYEEGFGYIRSDEWSIDGQNFSIHKECFTNTDYSVFFPDFWLR